MRINSERKKEMTDLAQFKGQQFFNIESYKKNGQAVRTPVWFVEVDGVFYARTEENSYKVRRIRRNPSVRLAPCKVNGEVTGEWIQARAEVVEDEELIKQVWLTYKRKYRLTLALFTLMGYLRRAKYAVVAFYPSLSIQNN